MSEQNYAFIKDGNVVNVALFDNPSNELLDLFKQEYQVDLIIPANEKASVGGTYDGEKFWRIKSFPSWVKNEELNEWVPPIEMPVQKGKYYLWDEETLSWLEFDKAVTDDKVTITNLSN